MKQSGFIKEGNEKYTLYASLPLSAINCFGTILAIAFVDR